MSDISLGALAGPIAILYVVLIFVGIFAAILWFFLPFAVFGTKAKLDLIIAEAQQTNEYLKMLVESRTPPVTPRAK